jgi:hypothetical protein
VARDDWRIRIHFDEPAHAHGLLERLGLALGGEAADLARELERRRLAVSFDEDDVFVYASSRMEAERASSVVEAVVREQGVADAHASRIERWLAHEERWDDEPPSETWEEDELEHGHAPWEVRVERDTHEQAAELADELEAEGRGVERRWKYLIVGASSEEDARGLARRLHGQAEPGGEVVWEAVPGNPFAVFGGLGGAGTPL